jgi:hypothetical protein
MDPQSAAFTPQTDYYRLEMLKVQHTQADHAERLARLERRQEDDARMKSVWGTSSPFPGVLSGTPQQGKLNHTLYMIIAGGMELIVNSTTASATRGCILWLRRPTFPHRESPPRRRRRTKKRRSHFSSKQCTFRRERESKPLVTRTSLVS